MLELKQITKQYTLGDNVINALNGIDLTFRENEFVSILGQSGCGKTTLLNLVGGLDQYTSGDLIINGRSTSDYNDKDWDTYRNHSIGFVFQSYNLISHQTVLSNVELALTISGVSKEERRRRAIEVLTKVGLADQLDKKPNQMSGGQMQRVAIARALINNPDILLADEPTGALDSQTSVAVMELLKEIAEDKLVIMVTHNPELAETYSTRIVQLLDGKIISDSMPYEPEVEDLEIAPITKNKPSMSFGTALSLSLNNLMTKKARTFLTAFAGSIGIIGIALIMSLSNGVQTYIDDVQEEALSSYPITLEAEAVDISSLISSMSTSQSEVFSSYEDREDGVYSNVMLYELVNNLTSMDTQTNNLEAFKDYLDSEDCEILDYASAISYGYDMNYTIYTMDANGAIIDTDTITLLMSIMSGMFGGDFSSYFETMSSFYSNIEAWDELLPDENLLVNETITSQYEVLYGNWPEAADEIVLFVDANNEVSDLVLYSLGLKSDEEMTEFIAAAQDGIQLETSSEVWSYEEICGHTFKLILPAEQYQYDETTGTYNDLSTTSSGMDYLYNSEDIGTTLTIVGIVRSNSVEGGPMQGSIGYTAALTAEIIEKASSLDIILDQMENEEIDIILNLPFKTEDYVEPTIEEKTDAVNEYIAELSTIEQADLYVDLMCIPTDDYIDATVSAAMDGMTREDIEASLTDSYTAEMGVDSSTVMDYIASMDDATLFSYVEDAIEEEIRSQYAAGVEASMSSMSADQLSMALVYATVLTDSQIVYIFDNYVPATYSSSTYEDNLDILGYVSVENPSSIMIYATTFTDKDMIADLISDYNNSVDEDDEITYTDYVAILMSSVTSIISAVSYVLIAFVAISLVVSSIMIGIITYISVLERTKEIGILRAIGASKRDISRVFNAETLIVGFCAGAIGIITTVLLNIPINNIIVRLTGITNMKSSLPVAAAVALVIISMVLTFIAGLIPSAIAAKRDPVEALRTD